MSANTSARSRKAAADPARKLWAIACVVGVACFLTFGLIAFLGATGEGATSPVIWLLCLASLGLGIYSWIKVVSVSPRMHGQRAAARARLDKEVERTDP
jgi:hypothetical protein